MEGSHDAGSQEDNCSEEPGKNRQNWHEVAVEFLQEKDKNLIESLAS